MFQNNSKQMCICFCLKHFCNLDTRGFIFLLDTSKSKSSVQKQINVFRTIDTVCGPQQSYSHTPFIIKTASLSVFLTETKILVDISV